MVAREPAERSRKPVDRREEVNRWARVRPDVQVQLIDRLELGDLQEQSQTIGQQMGRCDRQGVVTGLPGCRGDSSGEP